MAIKMRGGVPVNDPILSDGSDPVFSAYPGSDAESKSRYDYLEGKTGLYPKFFKDGISKGSLKREDAIKYYRENPKILDHIPINELEDVVGKKAAGNLISNSVKSAQKTILDGETDDVTILGGKKKK